MKLLTIVLLAAAAIGTAAEKQAAFYFIDVGHGNATLIVSPSGESMLLDAGPGGAAKRIVEVARQAGLKQIDYMVAGHFHDDHFEAIAKIAAEMPLVNIVDHGPSIESDKSDDWWKQRRGPWFKQGMGKKYDEMMDEYKAAVAKSHHIVVKAGDKIPLKGMDVYVVSSAGKNITTPLKGAGAPNTACASADTRGEDDAEDGQSIGTVVSYSKFRFAYLGDATWNTANQLFCPNNLVGTVDAYLITHHAQSFPKSMGDYYYGLSCCSAAEVHGLHPRIAVLSLGSWGHVQGTPEAMKTVLGSPGFEDLWETGKVTRGGEKETNPPDQFIANLGETSTQPGYIKLVANADGSFTVTNSRNGFSKQYPARR